MSETIVVLALAGRARRTGTHDAVLEWDPHVARLEIARRYARVNQLNTIPVRTSDDTIGLAVSGKSWPTIQTTDSRGNREVMCYPGPDNTGALDVNCPGAAYGAAAPPGQTWSTAPTSPSHSSSSTTAAPW